MRTLKPAPAAIVAGSTLVACLIALFLFTLFDSSGTPTTERRVSVPLAADVTPPNTEQSTPAMAAGIMPVRALLNDLDGARDTEDGLSRQVFHYSGKIKGSLFEAAATQGIPFAVMDETVKIFSYDVDFQRDIQVGDQFEILAERFIDDNNRVKATHVLFASLTLSGQTLTAYRYVGAGGTANYFSSNGESLRKGLLKTPVDGADISSGFGMRVNPVLGFSMLHKGVDFAVVSGTPVKAAGDGIVEVVATKGAYGRYVRIRHDSAHQTAYAHLSRYAKGLCAGSRVSQGEIIAYSGTSGRSTGPHLHYEVLVNDAQVNPMKVKFPAHIKLTGRELSRFLAIVRRTGAVIAAIPVTTNVALNRPATEVN